ncbi:MAG: 1,4-beta-xylanase [Firmicutes bacterium]|jgi:GH35 family endo-1,4-beta-xylanase|nr:endo-1,4-beta-xylanase [Bacillota bacterium]NLO65097.1 1,4-beta-xylanase [Bacillota bacterium]
MYNLDQSIKKIRAADVKLTVKSQDGTPISGGEVEIAQTNHKFQLGSMGRFMIPYVNNELTGEAKERAEEIKSRYLDLFNFVTLPFYWGRFEPVEGQPDTERVLNTAKWFKDQGIPSKGHPLCWHTVCADWLMDYSNEEIMRIQLERIKREVTDFKGYVDVWDVINEVVIMPNFDKYDNAVTRICKEYGRIETVRRVFEAAREANPNAILLINDFDTSPAYDILVEGCLEAGIDIDVIGIQSHMHQGYWGVEKTERILARFERFNRPIHFTETNLVSGELMPKHIVDLNDWQVDDWPTTEEGEARQAEEAVLHYKTLLAHPLVEAITWWDFVDGQWLNAPSGLLRKDLTPKPAYQELYKLVKGEWWLEPTTFRTAEDGSVSFNGFLGEYELRYQGKTVKFNLAESGEAVIEVVV